MSKKRRKKKSWFWVIWVRGVMGVGPSVQSGDGILSTKKVYKLFLQNLPFS